MDLTIYSFHQQPLWAAAKTLSSHHVSRVLPAEQKAHFVVCSKQSVDCVVSVPFT